MVQSRTNRAADPRGTQSWLSVVRAYNLCEAEMNARLASAGLRPGDHEVLVNLLSAPGLTQRELARRCFVTKSGVSMLLTRMEADGLVVRRADPNDARVRLLTLTKRGETLAKKAAAVQVAVVGAMASVLTDEELAKVQDVMLRVSARLEALGREDDATRRARGTHHDAAADLP